MRQHPFGNGFQRRIFPRKAIRKTLLTVLGSLFASGGVYAVQIDSGNSDSKISWDNTIKYSAAWRVRSPDASVADSSIGSQANTNDGDLNFGKGLISNRLDLLSEFEFRYKRDFGFRMSGAAWYDDVYNHSNDNPGALGGALVNSRSAGYNEFTQATERLHGKQAELLDIFGYANFAPGNVNVNVKGGRFTQLYGESLFFGSNGIAGAQTPLDLIKALSVPNSQFKEIARPVGQLSTQVQLSPTMSVGAYYQLEWRKTRLPAAGSYFSFADFVDVGGESLILGPGLAVLRGRDIEPSNSGQGGAQVKLKYGDTEYGIYVAQFHDKLPQFYVRPGVNVKPGSVGDYVQVFGEKIRTVGASFSTLLGEANVAGELSFRDNMPLVATGNTVILPGNTTANGRGNAAYPVGQTMHLNLSAISVFAANRLWQGASFIGELAFNRRLKVTDNPGQLDPLATRDASALQFIFQPEYFQVVSGVDLQVPIGVSYGISGRSSVNGALFPAEHGGNFSIGVKADYQKIWQASLNFSHYYGPAGSVIRYNTAVPELSYKNFHGDRDFVSLSIQRTF